MNMHIFYEYIECKSTAQLQSGEHCSRGLWPLHSNIGTL